MKKNERLELARWAMERALKSGADQVAVTLARSRAIQIEYRDGRLEKLKESTQSSLGLDVYVDRCYSGNATNNLDRDSLARFIEEAIAGTRYLAKDEYRSLPDPGFYPDGTGIDLKINDPGYEAVESSHRKRIAAEIESVAMAQDERIISTTSSYSDNHSSSIRVHSNGFAGESESTSFWSGAEVTMEGKNGGRPADWFYAGSRFSSDLPTPETIARTAVSLALRKIGQKKIDTGHYDMIVENRAVGRLVQTLLTPMEAKELQQKNSFLENMIGRKVASEKLTMIDDPFIEKGFGSRHFDGEGLAAGRRVMIEKGVLRNYYIDDYYGRKLAMEPTSGSSSNLVFEYGSRSLDEMIAHMRRGILVTSFIGGNSNSTTGDYSFGIVGQLIENGTITTPVNEMNISGNAKELWNRLVELGNDPYLYSATRRPSMVFEGVGFSGI